MIRNSQFKISTLLMVTFFAALIVKFGHIWQVTAAIAEFSLIIAGSGLLLRHLPRNVKMAVENNCKRADGSWSSQREQQEYRAWARLRSNVRFLMLLVVLPWNLLYWYDQFEVWLLAATTVLGAMLSCLMIRQGYLQFLGDYVFCLKRRKQEYTLRDLKLIADTSNCDFKRSVVDTNAQSNRSLAR